MSEILYSSPTTHHSPPITRLDFAAMKIDPFKSDESTITPPNPGAALVRLSQVIGALSRSPYSNSVPENAESLARPLIIARDSLYKAIEDGQNVGTIFSQAQKSLQELFAQVAQNHADDADLQAQALLNLGFPDPRLLAQARVAAVEVATVVVTHFKPVKQVFTTIAFDEAHGATAYWLHEKKWVADEPYVDAVMENWAPQFPRVRMPVGKHTLIIESRDPSYSVMSREFEIEVPQI